MALSYLSFLEQLHAILAPRTYLEIGVLYGHSLSKSRCRSVAIDPAYQVQQPVQGPVTLVRSTSDEYFRQLEASGLTPFGALPVDLAFVDGMHLFEYGLRDFINVERHSCATTVVAFDDVFPISEGSAARERPPGPWSGDIFRLPGVLSERRPDLLVLMVDTSPCGLMVVTGLDPTNRVLVDSYDEIVASTVGADPQHVPPVVLRREGAMVPEDALALPAWRRLRTLREASEPVTAETETNG